MNNCLQYFDKEWSETNPFNLLPYLESLLKKIEKKNLWFISSRPEVFCKKGVL